MTFGSRIKAEREARQWTQGELAARAGLPLASGQQVVEAIEKRSSTRSKHAPALAEALDLALEWALTGKGDKRRTRTSHPGALERTGSTFELHLPETLRPMARESLQRIIYAAAAADGKLDAFLEYVAEGLEKGLARHAPDKVRPMSKDQLALVRTVSMFGGTLHDAQARGINQTIWGSVGMEDPDTSQVVKKANKKSRAK